MFGDASALRFGLGLCLPSWLPAGYPELGSRLFYPGLPVVPLALSVLKS